MLDERTIDVVHIPFWYRASLRGSVFGILFATIVGVVLEGPIGLLVLLLAPALLLFRLFRFEQRRMRVRITDAFEVIEKDVAVAIPLARVSVHDHRGATVDLEIRFPYQGKFWRGVIARKDPPGAITASQNDDPALYAQIRGILNSR